MGRIWFMLSAVFAENEREVIRERTNVGLQAARAIGRKGGRKLGLTKESVDKAISAKILFEKGEKTVEEICSVLQISRATFYRYLEFTKTLPESPITKRNLK